MRGGNTKKKQSQARRLYTAAEAVVTAVAAVAGGERVDGTMAERKSLGRGNFGALRCRRLFQLCARLPRDNSGGGKRYHATAVPTAAAAGDNGKIRARSYRPRTMIIMI